MKNYKLRLFGAGVRGEHILPFNMEPTQEQIENAVIILIEKGLMELKLESGFHRKDHWTLTYEEIKEDRDKQLVLGTWV
jgi:hypothetical protein|tara:strand:+ start:180 stop:416 length:237 start_codon:yes stop_codon:yes gene_type:complete